MRVFERKQKRPKQITLGFLPERYTAMMRLVKFLAECWFKEKEKHTDLS